MLFKVRSAAHVVYAQQTMHKSNFTLSSWNFSKCGTFPSHPTMVAFCIATLQTAADQFIVIFHCHNSNWNRGNSKLSIQDEFKHKLTIIVKTFYMITKPVIGHMASHLGEAHAESCITKCIYIGLQLDDYYFYWPSGWLILARQLGESHLKSERGLTLSIFHHEPLVSLVTRKQSQLVQMSIQHTEVDNINVFSALEELMADFNQLERLPETMGFECLRLTSFPMEHGNDLSWLE
eukprot:Gb_03116 [translate_table: standard]